MVFPVVVSECESWTIKKVERQRIHAFALWFWRRLLRVPLDCKEIKPVNPKGNQSWIFIGRTDAEAEPLILWPPNLKSWLIRKDPNAGKDWGEGDDRGWGGWMILLTWWSWVWASSGRWWRTGKPGVLQPMVLPRVGHDFAIEQQQQYFLAVYMYTNRHVQECSYQQCSKWQKDYKQPKFPVRTERTNYMWYFSQCNTAVKMNRT